MSQVLTLQLLFNVFNRSEATQVLRVNYLHFILFLLVWTTTLLASSNVGCRHSILLSVTTLLISLVLRIKRVETLRVINHIIFLIFTQEGSLYQMVFSMKG